MLFSWDWFFGWFLMSDFFQAGCCVVDICILWILLDRCFRCRASHCQDSRVWYFEHSFWGLKLQKHLSVLGSFLTVHLCRSLSGMITSANRRAKVYRLGIFILPKVISIITPYISRWLFTNLCIILARLACISTNPREAVIVYRNTHMAVIPTIIHLYI